MPVIVDWYDKDKNVVMVKYLGKLTIEDMINGDKEMAQHFRQASGRLDMIVDILDSSYTPPVGALWEWKQQVKERVVEFKDWGFSVVVVESPIIRAYIQEGIETSDIIRQHTRLAKSVAEAVKMIEADRQGKQSDVDASTT